MENVREEFVKKITQAKNDLKRYDSFFDKLEKGMIVYEQLAYDDCEVKVLEWNRETGKVIVDATMSKAEKNRELNWYDIGFELRKIW